MKQHYPYIVLLLFCMLGLTTRGQWSEIADQSYLMAGGGLNTYFTDDPNSAQDVGFHVDATYGLHLYHYVGFRVQASVLNATNAQNDNKFYINGHFDITCNLFKKIVGEEKAQAHQLTAFIGIGVIHRIKDYKASFDNDFCLVPGLTYSCPLYNDISLIAELKGIIYPPKFDYNEKVSGMLNLSVGILYRICDNPYRNGISSSSLRFLDDWYMSIAGGVNILNDGKKMGAVGPALDLSVGKYLSPITSIRLSLSGIQAASSQTSFTFGNLHGDLIFNVNNMFYKKQNRKWNFSVYVGGGIIARSDTRIATINVMAGVLPRLWITDHSDIYADVRYSLIPSVFSDIQGVSSFKVGMTNALLGYNYYFGGTKR